jgi:hypothetical protein
MPKIALEIAPRKSPRKNHPGKIAPEINYSGNQPPQDIDPKGQ